MKARFQLRQLGWSRPAPTNLIYAVDAADNILAHGYEAEYKPIETRTADALGRWAAMSDADLIAHFTAEPGR